ncbi:hypothetical protein I5907_12325 [Panacibacter sp. DH6]|uniref:DUF3592 domain-containing protein n=1 Tax=Panacibacter microcysteis TaxID=2793269 RepID=A0A931GYP1_9BACT|nr:DUF3592 domain-containing protein [Panacibacter microcysteis]MBG9377022.1 hypothetical protein [Panacibacter microcysteis]
MIKITIILYLTCFGLYLLFSRTPDFIDGEITKATIHYIKDSTTGKPEPFAFYKTDRKSYAVKAGYHFRSLKEGQQVDLIFEGAQPKQAAVYSWWGYWITTGEVLFSIGLLVVMYYIAVSVTNNPTPEAVMEQLNYKPVKKRKYET